MFVYCKSNGCQTATRLQNQAYRVWGGEKRGARQESEQGEDGNGLVELVNGKRTGEVG